MTWRWIARPGTSPIEAWIGEYFIRVAQRYIQPRLTWERLDYRAPLTVVIDGPRLDADGAPILALNRLTLQLAGVPRQGEPVVIERIELDSPAFKFFMKPDGGLVGWSDFLRPDERRASIPAEYRVSQAFRMRSLSVRSAGIEFRPRENEPAMVWTGISATLQATPTEGAAGWYRLAAGIARPPMLDVTMHGRFNIDHFAIELDPLHLAASLQEADLAAIPPTIADWLRDRRVHGSLDLSARGTITPSDLAQTRLAATLDLRDLGMEMQGEALRVDSMRVAAEVAGVVTRAEFTAKTLGGQVEGSFTGELSDAPVLIRARLEHIELTALSRLPIFGNSRPPVRLTGGRLEGDASASLAPANWAQSTLSFNLLARDVQALLEPQSMPYAMPAAAASPNPVRCASISANGEVASGRTRIDLSTALGAGSAAVSLHDAGGALQLEIRLTQADLQQLAALLPVRQFGGVALDPIGGRITGQGTVKFLGAGSDRLDVSASCRLDEPRARIAGRELRATAADVQLAIREDRLNFDSTVTIDRGQAQITIRTGLAVAGPIELQVRISDLEAALLLDLVHGSLPPQMDLGGRLRGEVSARFQADDWAGGTGRAALRIDQCDLRTSAFRAVAPRVELSAALANRGVDFDYRIDAFSGNISGNGRAALDGARPLAISWDAVDFDLAQVFRSFGTRKSSLSGKLATKGGLRLDLDDATRKLAGSSAGSIDNAVLTSLPIVSDVLGVIRTNLPTIVPGLNLTDRVCFRCDMESAFVNFDQLDFETPALVARGQGRIHYDGAIEMEFTARPLGKLTSLLGPARRLFDEASDRLMVFQVSGTISQPLVIPRPLGIKLP